jgi:hypothetical protein
VPGPTAASLRAVDTTFTAELSEWRGPAPFCRLALPEDV